MKVPGIRGHLARKEAAQMSNAQADEIFSRAHKDVLSNEKNGKVADDATKEISG